MSRCRHGRGAIPERPGHAFRQLPLCLAGLPGLSSELRQALARVRPTTLGGAARVPGMTPAALTLLYRHAKKAA